MSTQQNRSGRCSCGAVQFDTSDRPIFRAYCHCTICQKYNGAAYADLDSDGDLDLVVNNIEAEPFVYRNNSESLNENNFLRVSLVGDDANTFGVGARVEIHLTENEQLIQEVMPTR